MARPKYYFEVYAAANDDYRWRLVARNGKIIADSGEGYRKIHYTEKAVKNIIDFFYITPPETPGLTVRDETPPKKKRGRPAKEKLVVPTSFPANSNKVTTTPAKRARKV